MNFEALEKSPQVAPLLVRLYDTQNLYALADNKNSQDSRLELTTIMVDLLNVRLSPKESELITDVLLGLMKRAEQDLRAALSERISALDSVPLRIVLSLANDDVSVADPVLRQSPILQDLDLLYILHAKGVGHGRSIAQRKGLNETLINALIDTKDLEIAVNLSENDGIKLTEYAYKSLLAMSRSDARLARPLILREDLPAEIAREMYTFVSDELKKNLAKKFGKEAGFVIGFLDDVTQEMTDGNEIPEENVHDRLLAAARNLQRRGELKPHDMISTLRRGQIVTFMAQFSVYMDLPMETIKSMVRRDKGKGLAIACKAKDVSKADFVSLYLLTEKIRSSAKRVFSHQELSRIMTMYDEINLEDAVLMIKNFRH